MMNIQVCCSSDCEGEKRKEESKKRKASLWILKVVQQHGERMHQESQSSDEGGTHNRILKTSESC